MPDFEYSLYSFRLNWAIKIRSRMLCEITVKIMNVLDKHIYKVLIANVKITDQIFDQPLSLA